MASAERRVAFVNILGRPEDWPGLQAKLAAQRRAALRAGLPWDVLVLADVAAEDARALHCRPGLPPRLQRRLLRADLVARSVDLSAYAALVLRYQGAVDPSWLASWRRLPPIVAELHTDQLGELRPDAGSPVGALRYGLERAVGAAFLRRCAGLITVTDELGQRLAARCRLPPRRTIANGIEVASLPASGCRALGRGPLELVMASAGFEWWQGVDRVIHGLLRQRGGPAVELHLLGRLPPSLLRLVTLANRRLGRVAIHAHGVVGGAEAESIYQRAVLGLSTLAVHRKRMRQACPLKSREYCARGLPFAYAYDDPDLAPLDLPLLRLPADERPIEIEALVAYARALEASGVAAVSARLRAAAERHLDWAAKLHDACRFAQSCAARRSRHE